MELKSVITSGLNLAFISSVLINRLGENGKKVGTLNKKGRNNNMNTEKKLQQLKILFPKTSEEKLQMRAELELELETKAKEKQEQFQALSTPQSMNDLKSCLILAGEVERYTDERAKVRADLSGLTIPRLKPRVVANILEKYLHIAKLGQNSEERAKSS